MHVCHLQQVKQLQYVKEKVTEHKTVNEAQKESKTREEVQNEEEIDSIRVGVVIQCACCHLRELSLLANKEEVGENKAEVA